MKKAGVTLLVSFAIIALIFLLKVPITNLFSSDYISILNKNILREGKDLSTFYDNFNREDSTNWQKFIPVVESEYDARINLRIVERSIPLYKTKDSVTLGVYNNIYKYLIEAEEQYPQEIINYPLNSKIITSVIKDYENYSDATFEKLNAMIEYHKNVFESTANAEQLFNKYNLTENKLDLLRKNYQVTLNKFNEGIKKVSKLYKPWF